MWSPLTPDRSDSIDGPEVDPPSPSNLHPERGPTRTEIADAKISTENNRGHFLGT